MAKLGLEQAFQGSASHLPRITFYTSSRAKYQQARLIFEACGLSLKSRVDGVDEQDRPEDETGTKEELLTKVIKSILSSSRAPTSFFFVEDTSIRIDALSPDQDHDFPGLSAKSWFQGITFEGLRQLIGSNRSCSVESGIGLYVPGLADPVFFYGRTKGEIVAELPHGVKNHLYPWLDPDSFSGWFSPIGTTKTLASMEYEESLEYDFRAESLSRLVHRLAEYSAVVNTRDRLFALERVAHAEQAELPGVIPDPHTVVLTIGLRCAGKTTAAHFLRNEKNWSSFVDGSSIVKQEWSAQGKPGNLDDFARDLLAADPSFVARRIIELYNKESNFPLVVAGLRTIQEVDEFRKSFPSVRVISIQASQRDRYLRYVKRASRTPMTSEEFIQDDERQLAYGLLRVSSYLADEQISNSDSMERFCSLISHSAENALSGVEGVAKVGTLPTRPRNELYRCLRILSTSGRAMSCVEISEYDAVALPRIDGSKLLRPNNINRTLKRYPELVSRHDEHPIKYSATANGQAFVTAFERLLQRPTSPPRGLSQSSRGEPRKQSQP